MPLSKLYVTPLDGFVTVIVPVATVHVGCITVVVGCAGRLGGAFIVASVALDEQPNAVFLATTWYVPAVKPLNVAAVW